MLMSIIEIYNLFLQNPSVVTDTRKIKHGDIFFALKGGNFNGNHFAGKALELGATYCVVDEDTGLMDDRIVLVDDVLTTLQSLARHHRLQFNIPFLAITGSNGKTTTKELIHTVLSTTFRTYTTEGNLNNHIGIPLTLLKVKPDAEIAVVEMGANHQREIAGYCEYALPTHGLINNCGKAHLEGFGGEEGVRKGKGELYDFIRSSQQTIFRNNDYDYLEAMSKGIEKIITYGSKNNADLLGEVESDKEMLSIRITKGANLDIIHTKLIGGYNLPNVLAAVCVGKIFGVSEENIHKALESYEPTNSRSQLLLRDTCSVVLDAYNANPSSMKLAIENFASMQGNEKVLMLGAMAELGEESQSEHDQLVHLIRQYKWKAVVLVGEGFRNCHGNYLFFETSLQAALWFREQGFKHTQILIKGSRSMKMERVLD